MEVPLGSVAGIDLNEGIFLYEYIDMALYALPFLRKDFYHCLYENHNIYLKTSCALMIHQKPRCLQSRAGWQAMMAKALA